MAISPLPEWARPRRRIAIVSDFFGINTAEAQALERAGMHIINILSSEAPGHCIQTSACGELGSNRESE